MDSGPLTDSKVVNQDGQNDDLRSRLANGRGGGRGGGGSRGRGGGRGGSRGGSRGGRGGGGSRGGRGGGNLHPQGGHEARVERSTDDMRGGRRGGRANWRRGPAGAQATMQIDAPSNVARVQSRGGRTGIGKANQKKQPKKYRNMSTAAADLQVFTVD